MREIKPIFIMAAKGDSKRLPRKNLKMIGGKPLFIHAFDTMMETSEKYKYSKVIFATESEEVKNELYKHYGYWPWIHEPYGSNIHSTNIFIYNLKKEQAKDPYQLGDVCKLVLDTWQEKVRDNWPLVMVQATNPFIMEEDIHRCINMFVTQTDVDSVRAVKVLNRLWRISTNAGAHKIDNIIVKSLGSIVVCNPKYVKHMGSFPLTATIPYFLPKERAIDINDELDFLYAEAVMEKYKKC